MHRRQWMAWKTMRVGILLLVVSCGLVAQEIGSVNRNSTRVSLVSILADPLRYHRKQIRTVGVIHLAFESNSLFLSKEHRTHFIASNAIRIDLHGTNFSEEGLENINGNYVIIEGRINADDPDVFVATIEQINRIDNLEHEP